DDLVIHGNIAKIDVVNVDAVSGLADWRVFFQFTDVRLPGAGKPPIPDMNFSNHGHKSCRTAAYADVARTSQYFPVPGASYLIFPFKSSLYGSAGCRRKTSKNCQQNRK